MKKGIFSLITWSLPFTLLAQSSLNEKMKNGIHWATDGSWQQVKERAKAENKYIFVDAFTTWCGPCQYMDKKVYTNDTVGDYFNKNFISVKIQMDTTEKDDEYVKNWYADAEALNKEYVIDAFPSLLFFTPDGTVADLRKGLKKPAELIALAKAAATPGKTYSNPYKEYDQLVKDYKQGIKNYEKMPGMIEVALKFKQWDFTKELLEDHWNYVSKVSPEERFKKENIQLWGDNFTLGSNGSRFQFFYKNGKRIDEIMGNGYAAQVVDRTIDVEVVDSFFRMQKGETTTITGKRVPNKEVMFMWLPVRTDGRIEPDYQEADWKQLSGMLKEKYNKETVERNVLQAKKRWYQQHQNIGAYVETNFQLLKNYSTGLDNVGIGTVNNDGFFAFKYSNNEKLLNIYIKWLEKIGMPKRTDWPNGLDTYANLLYKVGRVSEAIKYEDMAWRSAMTNERYQVIAPDLKNVVEKMKRGEPTYTELGAIWPKKNE